MDWIRRDDYFEEAEDSSRIAAAKVCEQWSFSAFAPPLTEQEFESKLKVQYALGEPVPQRSALLGSFPSAAAARAACERHFLKSVTPPDCG